MRRTGMKRGRRRSLTAEERRQSYVFHAAFNHQPCAVCGTKLMNPEAHHVVEAQELRGRSLPVYDTRNALPLCQGCHANHTSAACRVPFRKLRPENIAYAYEVLGDFAGDYLKKRYPMKEQL